MSRLLTLSEVARVLGLCVRKVRDDERAGRFGPEIIRFKRSVRVRESELAAWIDSGCPNRVTWRAARKRVSDEC